MYTYKIGYCVPSRNVTNGSHISLLAIRSSTLYVGKYVVLVIFPCCDPYQNSVVYCASASSVLLAVYGKTRWKLTFRRYKDCAFCMSIVVHVYLLLASSEPCCNEPAIAQPC